MVDAPTCSFLPYLCWITGGKTSTVDATEFKTKNHIEISGWLKALQWCADVTAHAQISMARCHFGFITSMTAVRSRRGKRWISSHSEIVMWLVFFGAPKTHLIPLILNNPIRCSCVCESPTSTVSGSPTSVLWMCWQQHTETHLCGSLIVPCSFW